MAKKRADAPPAPAYQDLLGRLDRIEARIADCHRPPRLLLARHRQIIDAVAAREARIALETPCPGLLACLRVDALQA